MRNTLLSLLTAVALFVFPNVSFGQTAPSLGWASTFSLFTAAGAFNGDPGTNIIGDIGTNAGAYTPPGTLVGTAHVVDPVSLLAATDVAAAFMALNSNNTCGVVLGTPFGNQTLPPNVYCLGGASVLNGNLILDAGGNPNAIFVFKVGGTLSTNALSTITLAGGANFCNVYFWVNGAVTLGSGSVFQGTIIAAGAINLQAATILNGRGLTTMGAISTVNNTVNIGACAVALPPIVTCPANVTVSCASQVPVANPASVMVTAACPGMVTVISLGDVISNQTCPNRFTITRTYQVTDACGNVVTCAQTITVNDQTPPTITCPGNVSVSCAGQVPQGSNTAAATSDNCGGAVTVTFADVISNQTCANRFTVTRTYTATDACGNVAMCAQTITVNDLTPPTITCPGNVSVSCVPPADPTTATATDNCGGATVTFAGDAIVNQRCANGLTINRTYRATDACGSPATCVQMIIVNDQTPPSITCPTNVTVSCAGQVPTANPASVITSDNCGGAVTVTFVGDVISNQTCANRYTITRTYQATDACGNVAMCAQIITVNDQTAPSITCPATLTVSCAGQVPTANPASVITSDNCGGAVTVTFVGDIISNQTCANRFTITRTYLATDACGNTASCAQMITVNDQTPPTITCPGNVSVTCASQVPLGSNTAAVTSDNCGGAVTVTFADVISNQICANRFTITRTYRAIDACGNTATCAQTITVNDQTAPTITCPGNISVTCASQVPVGSTTAVTTSDNCGGAVTVTFADVITNQICANRFTITRTYTAIDACGNTATCAQTIIVNDQTAPTITCPGNVSVTCASQVPVGSTTAVTTSDNCGGAVTVTFADVITNQICANRFTITRTYTATDACGNTATCAQTIIVNDQTAPTIICPGNITVSCASQTSANLASVIASDNCSAVTIIFNDVVSSQTCLNRFIITRTYTAADACGSTATCIQTITVNDQTAPTITCPANITVSCASEVPVANPASVVASDNCGGVTVTLVSDVISNQICANRFTITRTYQVMDACGNIALCAQTITVNDQTAPVFTVLPQNLSVECAEAANIETLIQAWLGTFGGAQAISQCGATPGITTQFISEVPACEGSTSTFVRTYQFMATDACGNISTALATFSLIDTTPPTIICPPGNLLLTCGYDLPAPDPSAVVAYDNCGESVKLTLTIYSVGTGCAGYTQSVDYWYMAMDKCGNMSNCDQSFQIIDSIPPLYTGPDTLQVGCVDDLPGAGEITGILAPYMSDNCSDVICFGRVVTQDGNNSVTFTVKAKDLCGNWTQRFNVTFVATGICQPLCTATQTVWGDPAGTINGLPTTTVIEQLLGEYGGVTAGKLGKTITTSSAPCVQSMLPGSGTTAQFNPGQHTFSAANGCDPSSPLLNNDATLKNKLAANVMAMQFNIWYNLTFHQRSLGVQQLTRLPACLVDPIVLGKMEADLITVQGLLNLSNDYLAGVGFFPQGFGELLSDALDNLNAYWQNCQVNTPCPVNVSVAGSLKTEPQDGVEEVAVNLVGSYPTIPPISMFAVTDAQGSYMFSNAVPPASNLTVTPTKDDNPLNGVTTYDLALISKHILGLEPLSSPYKMIAADANKSGSITAFDIVELRKLILGIYQELPDNNSWRFVDKSFVFPNPANPFQTIFSENKTVANIQASQIDDDFVAVKIGDVNQSAIANTQQDGEDRTAGTLLLEVEDHAVKAGDTFDVTFKTVEAAQAFQFTLNLNGLTVTEITSGDQVSAENFGVFQDTPDGAGPNALTVSLNGALEFTVSFRAATSGKVSDLLNLSSRITKAEAYNMKGEREEVALRFRSPAGITTNGLGFELYQNQPNPFQSRTIIGFHLPVATSATLTVYDESGRTLFSQQGDYAKGYNYIPVELSVLNTSGLLYYKLETATDVATKKMIQSKE